MATENFHKGFFRTEGIAELGKLELGSVTSMFENSRVMHKRLIVNSLLHWKLFSQNLLVQVLDII
jgi:hypothetical protein